MKIETDRLIIREFTMDMAPDVWANSLDEDNRRFVPDEVFETVKDAEETISFLISQYGGKAGPLAFPVFTKSDGVNIGYVQIVPISESDWEIGYHIAKRHTGHGYATEAVKTFLPVITEDMGITAVHGICLSENIASKHVLRKCGFIPVYEGPGDYQGETCEIFRSIRTAPFS